MSVVRPFEEYKEMIKDMPKEEMIRGLYDLSARVTKQENIIKEVREYINNHQLVFEMSSKKQILDWFDMFYKQLLEILDKTN